MKNLRKKIFTVDVLGVRYRVTATASRNRISARAKRLNGPDKATKGVVLRRSLVLNSLVRKELERWTGKELMRQPA